jgi:hypothetical protein
MLRLLLMLRLLQLLMLRLLLLLLLPVQRQLLQDRPADHLEVADLVVHRGSEARPGGVLKAKDGHVVVVPATTHTQHTTAYHAIVLLLY